MNNIDYSKQVVHTDSIFSIDESFQDDRFLRVRIAAMHSGENRNGSYFDIKVIEDAKNSFANIPILADIQEFMDKNGDKYLDYSGHSMHIEQDAFDSEQDRIIYDEKVVGIIPETNDFEIVKDEETGNDYVLVTGFIFKEYGNYASDIIESRGGKTDVSMEINCDDISFDLDKKVMNVGKMTACALTLLGADVAPGMKGANAQVFEVKTTFNREEQLLEVMQELKKSLELYTKEISKKGGNEVDNQEELFTGEVVAESEETVVETNSVEEDITLSEESTEGETVEEYSEESTEETSDVVNEEVSEEVVIENSLNYSISCGETKKDFAISLSDVIYSLTMLVNETYADENTYYAVDVFDDDKYIIMTDYMTGKSYKQSYKCKKKNYSLYGDRVPVKAVYLTEDEENALDKMRSSYSSISEKLEKYESEPQKLEILNSAKYEYISDTVEFKELMSQENHFDISVEDVKTKANDILLQYAEAGKLNFAKIEGKEKSNVGGLRLPVVEVKKKTYGNLFDGII